MIDPQAHTRASVAAACLAGGRRLDRLSTVLTLAALVAAVWWDSLLSVQGGLLLAITLGAMQKYYALRVAFDHRIFAHWARHWSSAGGADPAVAMAEFDAALASAGLRNRDGGSPRGLEERIKGALALWRRQAACLALQCLVVAATAWARSALS